MQFELRREVCDKHSGFQRGAGSRQPAARLDIISRIMCLHLGCQLLRNSISESNCLEY